MEPASSHKFSIKLDGEAGADEGAFRALENLYSLRRGSLPMNRGMGLDWSVLDDAGADAQSRFTVDVMEQTDKYMPEFRARGVEFPEAEGGAAAPVIHVERSE